MGAIKTCTNGHNFDSSLYNSCPYCPKGNTGEKTILNNSVHDSNLASSSSAKTRVVAPESSVNDGKTVAMKGISPDNQTIVPNGTRVIIPGDVVLAESRKLVGFIVSYDLNPQGKYFKIYEGKNLIGADPLCDITITGDSGVSAKHITILFRAGKFRFKDEFSTNGSYVNDEMLEEGYLQNHDILRVGRTRLAFMSIPLDLFK